MSVDRDCNIENQHGASKKMKVTTMKEEEKVLGTDDRQVEYHVILFYKYGPLSDDHEVMQVYKDSIIALGNQLNLTGRVLIGVSRNAEGINGTLAGEVKEDVLAFTYANMGQDWCEKNMDEMDDRVLACQRRKDAIEIFWKKSKDFMKLAKVPFLTLDSLEDFKWSSAFCSKEKNNNMVGPFPDLNIKLVKEIINTGGKFSSIDIEDTNKGHLTPEEWHKEMLLIQNIEQHNHVQKNETILIDCRNHKEYEIGHFSSALDPNTKTFEQFPRWVQENKTALDGKKILMYCTGGIRCEKASAFIRKETDALSVQHLKGGIHKYLDIFGSDGTFKGKNFVFDRRIAAAATKKDDKSEPNMGHSGEIGTNNHGIIVGKCLYCLTQHDTFTADGVCTVCREPTLVCPSCRDGLNGEFHCSDHQHLKGCYFTDLSRFGIDDLKKQANELENHIQKIAVGKRFKQRRKTLHKQLSKVLCYVEKLQKCHIGQSHDDSFENHNNNICRNCGGSTCSGDCWGFHGLSRKEKLKCETCIQDKSLIGRISRPSANQRSSKLKQKEEDINEIQRLNLSLPPSEYRDDDTSIRCPPPCVRLLKSAVKGKWCGRTVASVIESDFSLSIGKDINEIVNMGLIRLNGIPIDNERALKQSDKNEAMSSDEILKNMDVLSRLVHWHEPPVIVPKHIPVTKIELGKEIKDEFLLSSNDNTDTHIYCCNKPSTVPVHPAGPYLSNTLTIMVEAQASLDPRTLLPLHRLDRCVSGLVLCCTSPSVARLFQSYMNSDKISKLYLARVKGKFPGSQNEATITCPSNSSPAAKHAGWSWRNDDSSVEVNAPVEVIDASNGIRAVRSHGKKSTSRFCLISYDSTSNRSLIACRPITGRGHQLRVHLQWLGYPINNDVQYGGTKNSDSMTRETVFNAIKNAAEKETNGVLSVNENDVQLAQNTCLICRDVSNMTNYFNSAQLLDEGYSIDLHALKYKIYLEKKKKSVAPSSSKSNTTEIEFSVDFPSWIDLSDEVSSHLAEITKDFI